MISRIRATLLEVPKKIRETNIFRTRWEEKKGVFCHTGSFLDLRQLLRSRSASSTMAVPLTRLSTQHQSSCTSDRISCRQDRISKQRKIKDRILIMASLLLSPSTLVRGRSPPRDTIGSENLLRKIRSAVDLSGLRFSLHPSFLLPNCQLSGKSK